MIKLTEIKRENDIVSAVVTTVELNPVVFRVAYDVSTDQLVENTYGKVSQSVGMARCKLRNLVEEYGYDLPETAVSAWY